MKNLRTGEHEDVCDCIVAGLGSVGDPGTSLACPSSTAREFSCSRAVKFLRAIRKLRAERVGAGGGTSSGKSGLATEMVYVVRADIRLMDIVDTIDGAGVGCSVNRRVSSQNDHVDGIVPFCVLLNAKSNAADNRVVSQENAEGERTYPRQPLHRLRKGRNPPAGWLAWQRRLWPTRPATGG